MPSGVQQPVTIQTPPTGFLGLDTASEPTSIDIARSRRLLNGYQTKIKALGKRPGSKPITTTALGEPITHLMIYPFPQEIPAGVAPTLSAVAGVATLPSATYYVRYTYVSAEGETEASPETSQAIVLGESLRVVVPALPLHATSVNIYISTVTNTEKLELNAVTLSNDFTEPLDGTGVTYPTANTTTLRNDILAVSDDTIYSYYNDALNPITMTDPLNSSDVYDADFTGLNAGVLVNVKIIADGGILKQVKDGVCEDVSPATDDAGPAPINVLTDINALGIKYVWTHSNYVFVNCGDNQIFYSKQATQAGADNQYDYFPETNYTILVRKGDYVNGCGIPFDDVCFIPMRQGWSVNTGTNFNDFGFGEYLNTINGLIAPRSPAIITKGNGQQTIAFLSDSGVHEIFTTVLDNRGKQYATRNLMEGKIDFESIGFTEAEKSAAVATYYVSLSMYLLEIARDGTNYVYGFDTRNEEWYMWTGLTINTFIERNSVAYFAGDGFLKQFDRSLNSDWTNYAMTTGTPVDFDRITGMIWFEDTGYESTLDYYILRLKQYDITATLDISLVYLQGTVDIDKAIQNQYAIWDTEGSYWDEAIIANLDYTDLVSAPQRLSNRLQLPKKGFFFQLRWQNNRDEPVEVYSEKFIARTSGEV